MCGCTRHVWRYKACDVTAATAHRMTTHHQSLDTSEPCGQELVAPCLPAFYSPPCCIVSQLHTELSAALVECGWDQAHVHQVLSSLPSDHDDTTGQGAGGRVQVSLDSFLARLLAASLYKSVFST
jgi:hypothetical protein